MISTKKTFLLIPNNNFEMKKKKKSLENENIYIMRRF